MTRSGFHFFGPVILVGRQGDRRHIVYSNILFLTIWLSLILGGGVSGVYWMLSGRFLSQLPIMGLMWALGMVGLGIMKGFRCRIDELKSMED